MKRNIEDMFLMIALLFGFISILLIPPFQSPDELSHFQRAYSISKGQFYYSIENDSKGLYIDDELTNYISKFDRFNGNIDQKYSYEELYFDQEMPKLPTAKSHKFFSTVETSFVAYIAPSIGIIVSKVFRCFIFKQSTTYAYSLYFARLFCLLLYIGVMYISIKKTPILKKTLVTVGLLPMSIMLSSSCTYDGLIIGVSCLFFSYFLNFIYENKLKFEIKHIILFIVLGFFLFFVKYAYILLLLLLLFIPNSHFKSKKDKYIKIGLILGGVLVLYVLFNIPNYINSVASNGVAGEQIKYILSNPFNYILILFRSMYEKFGNQFAWILGGFGNLDTHFPGFIYFVMSIYILFLFLFDSSIKNSKLDFKFKVFNFLVLFGIVVLIYTALYVIWTPVGNSIIEGVQGRYFIPIIIFTPLLILGNKLADRFKTLNEFICDYYLLFSVMFLILYCIVLLLRYWC